MLNKKSLLFVAIFGACLILALNFGMRASMGFFMKPISQTFGYGREIFAFSLALQNLCWGLFQPFAGMFSDKYGAKRAIIFGAILYALGLTITSVSTQPWMLHTGAGILTGMGIAATGFGVILPAMAKMVTAKNRAMILGLGTAAGSAGQFLVIPVAKEFIQVYGWQMALVIMAIGVLSIIFLSGTVKGDVEEQSQTSSEKNNEKNPNIATASQQTLNEALSEATGHVHYWLLIAGFFVCGFQLAFITVHMPSYLTDSGFSNTVAAVSLSLIGFFNIIGSLAAGALSGVYSKKNLLGIIYAARAVSIAVFLMMPMTVTSVYLFSIITGLLWLATVPPTSGIVAQMFGLKHMGTLYGIVFLNHQLGSFMGVWLGGYFYDETGSYNIVWWAACVIAAITALIHIFIDERPVARLRNLQTPNIV